MRSFFILTGCLVLLTSATCKKTTTKKTPAVDSLQLNRSGGIAGLSDYYMIYPNKVMKDTSRNQSLIYNYPEPAKIKTGQQLLIGIPDRMWEENNHSYGTMVMDGIDFTITAYAGPEKYHWVIRHNPPAHVQPYMQKINDFFSN